MSKYRWEYKKQRVWVRVLFTKLNLHFVFQRAGNEQYSPLPQVCVDVQVHKSKFSKKYFPLVPEVFLLAFSGKIITLLSLRHNDSLILSPEAVATRWAFLLLLVNGSRRGYSASNQKRIFWQGQKRPSVSLNSVVPLVSILGQEGENIPFLL